MSFALAFRKAVLVGPSGIAAKCFEEILLKEIDHAGHLRERYLDGDLRSARRLSDYPRDARDYATRRFRAPSPSASELSSGAKLRLISECSASTGR